MHGFVLEEIVSFKMFRAFFLSEFDWDSYILSIAKTASKKIGAMILWIFFLLMLILPYKCPTKSFMEYCFHVWTSGPSCYLDMLDKLLKQIYRTVGSSLAASLEPFSVYSEGFPECFTPEDVYLYWLTLISLPHFCGRSTRYSNKMHVFLSPFLDVKRMSMSRHYKETLLLSLQVFLVLLWLALEGWQAESTLKPPGGFEPVTLILVIQCINN